MADKTNCWLPGGPWNNLFRTIGLGSQFVFLTMFSATGDFICWIPTLENKNSQILHSRGGC